MVTRALVGFGVAWGLLLSVTTMDRTSLWAHEPALWADAIVGSPAKPRPWLNLGDQEARAGQYDRALSAYQIAAQLALAPERTRYERLVTGALVELNTAVVWGLKGDLPRAYSLSARVVARYPAWTDAKTILASFAARCEDCP